MDIHERLIALRETLGMKQGKFASGINRAQSTYAGYELGIANIPDRTILDICRVYNVNEEWLRNGTGEMFKEQAATDEVLAEEFGKLLAGDDEFTKKLFLKYLQLPPEYKTAFREFLEQLVNDEKK